LLFSFNVECPPKHAIDRIDKQFDVFFPSKVLEEYRTRLAKGQLKRYEDVRPDIDLFFLQKKKTGKLIDERIYVHCLEYVKRFFSLTGKQKEYYALDEGEKHCVALGLYLSRRTKGCVLVLTDDFRAREAGIDLFVCRQCLGLVRSFLGAMVFIYCVNKDIPEWRILTIVNEYFALNPPKRASMVDFKEKILGDIKLCCKRQNFDRCSLSCLT
jgi:hypothetical protein